MRSFAAAYPDVEIVKQLVSQLPSGHVIRLLQRIKDADTRQRYIKASIEHGWPPHAVLMTSRASVGYFAMAGREVCTNQGFISVVSHACTMSVYLLFHLSERVEEIRAMGSGSTYPEVSRTKFREFEVLVPPHVFVNEFDAQATLLLNQIRVLKQQNQKLRAARDLLLPRLMSGELAV